MRVRASSVKVFIGSFTVLPSHIAVVSNEIGEPICPLFISGVEQPFRINESHWIVADIGVGINSPSQSDGVTLEKGRDT